MLSKSKQRFVGQKKEEEQIFNRSNADHRQGNEAKMIGRAQQGRGY